MYRSIPIANKLCFDKQLKRSWQIHEQKLKSLKCMIDFKKPPEFQFLNTRPKKQVLSQMRNFQILRQNKVLLEKITDIAVEGDIKKYLKRTNSSFVKKSLNQPYRKRELVKIVEQNQEMLKRIQQKKSCYNTKRMVKERQKIEKNINLISDFPFKDFKRNKTQVNLWVTNNSYRQRHQQQGNENKKDDINLHYKKTKKIGNSYYLINSSIKINKFVIQLENLQDLTQKYCLSLQIQQAKSFLKTYFNSDVQKMIENLKIDHNSKTCYLKYDENPNQINQTDVHTQDPINEVSKNDVNQKTQAFEAKSTNIQIKQINNQDTQQNNNLMVSRQFTEQLYKNVINQIY